MFVLRKSYEEYFQLSLCVITYRLQPIVFIRDSASLNTALWQKLTFFDNCQSNYCSSVNIRQKNLTSTWLFVALSPPIFLPFFNISSQIQDKSSLMKSILCDVYCSCVSHMIRAKYWNVLIRFMRRNKITSERIEKRKTINNAKKENRKHETFLSNLFTLACSQHTHTRQKWINSTWLRKIYISLMLLLFYVTIGILS